ncbi:MAG: hypothetical protein IKL90_03005 [Alphaproteobacteria bacterium]|nr:hypothetical protein [Alphaproteobacteria bacterium]
MQSYLSHQILNLQETKKIYQNYVLFCKKKALDYINHLPSFPSDKEKTLFLKKLQHFFLFCAKHNINEEKTLHLLKNIQTIQELNTLIQTTKESYQEKEIQEKKILLKGEFERVIHNYQRPSFFEERQRVYIKINKIPTLLSSIQECVDFLNNHLPDSEKIKLILKTKNVIKKTQGKKNQELAVYQYFVSDSLNKEIKIGKFLNTLYQQLIELKNFLNQLSLQEKDAFLSLFKLHEMLSAEAQKQLKYFFKKKNQKNIHLTPTLFSLIKKASALQHKETLPYFDFISDFLLAKKTTIHEMQIKQLEPIQNEQNEGDLILLSVYAKDIARISEYTDWETCMSYENENAHDLSHQIGYGSIVGYLINSKNPYKKLSRILLKPFASENEIKNHEKRLDIFYQGENKEKLKTIDRELTFSSNLKRIRREFYHFFNPIINTVSPIVSNSSQRLYLQDKQFGLQNTSFFQFLNALNQKYLSLSHPTGSFLPVGNYYMGDLNKSYFFADPYNPTHLCQFLNLNKYHYNIVQQNNQPYVFTKIIYAQGTHNLNLSGVQANYVTMETSDLKFIDARGLKTKTLTLNNCSNIEEISPYIQISEKLTFNGKNLTVLPKNIKAKEVVVNAPSLKFIPEDIETESLSIIDTNVQKLPDLKLKELFAKGTKIKDLRNVEVSDYLDLSTTPIQFLNEEIALGTLILKNCHNLKRLPSHLTVQCLDISNTSLLNIPVTHYKWLLINNNKKLNLLPKGVTFDILEAQNSSLLKLPEDIFATRVNIMKTNISSLPKNLKAKELDISQTNISFLPSDIKVDELKALKTKITTLPADIKIKKLDLRETPLETVHYSKNIHLLTLSHLPKFIHPALSPFLFVGFDEKDILKSKQRYIETYLLPLKITSKNILGPYQVQKNLFFHSQYEL